MLASAIARSEAARSAEVLRVGVESAGHYHRTLVARLRSGGYEVVELNPAAVKESRAQQILARLKSDARDLGAMAELMVRGAGRQPALRTDALATQAAWVAHRRRKVTARVALANQVIGELDLVFPGQLKHAATRITQAYIGKASSWVDPVLEEQRRAADRLYEAFLGYLGGEVVIGAGAEQHTRMFEGVKVSIEDRFPGHIADEAVVKAMLRQEAATFYPGTINDCAFDPARALCLKNQAGSAGGPLLSMCQPTRCANSTIGAQHRPAWLTTLARLDEILRQPESRPARRLCSSGSAAMSWTSCRASGRAAGGDGPRLNGCRPSH